MCLLRGRNCVFKSYSYSFVLKRLIKLSLSSRRAGRQIRELETEHHLILNTVLSGSERSA